MLACYYINIVLKAKFSPEISKIVRCLKRNFKGGPFYTKLVSFIEIWKKLGLKNEGNIGYHGDAMLDFEFLLNLKDFFVELEDNSFENRGSSH